ncbi:MAG TPA: hypothetical protein VFP84_18940 [Kofleriaceae bacterium]|nr:hypothetical protein [Kofleriaceae bacterium]
MRLRGLFNFVDLAIALVVLVAVVLPAREMYARAAIKPSQAGPAEQFAIALAEARTIAHPDDGAAVDDLSRRLGAVGFKDWAIETAVHGSERAKASPSAWRALLATSVAYVDRLDVVPALDFANRALSACEATGAACPSWEQVRMKLYQQHLDAGVRSGVDPHKGPAAIQAFRRAGESALRQIHLGGRDVTNTGAGSGSGQGSAGKP